MITETLSRIAVLGRTYLDVKRIHPQTIDEMLDFAMESEIAPAQVRSEIKSLLQRVQSIEPQRILEIGTARGGTLYLWCKVAHRDATIISTDLHGGEFGGGYHWAKAPLYKAFAEGNQKVHLLRGDSHKPETLSKIKGLLDGPLDFLLIDGDHTYEGVKQDHEMYSPLVRKGGLIAFHDIVEHRLKPGMPAFVADCHVDQFWNEVKNFYRHEEFIEDPKQNFAGVGLLYI